jgi:pimeloyl-ACP methyl ester carboxylesterase
MIAQQYASDYPDALSGLLLIDTSASFEGWNPEETTRVYADEPWYPQAHDALSREPTTDEEAKADFEAIVPFYFAHAGSQMESFRNLIAPYRMNLAPGKQFDIQMHDLRPQLGGIRVPALVVVGEQDWICTVPMAEALATNIPNAQLVVLQDCGHFPWLEAREPFHAAIQQFVTVTPHLRRRGFWRMFRR